MSSLDASDLAMCGSLNAAAAPLSTSTMVGRIDTLAYLANKWRELAAYARDAAELVRAQAWHWRDKWSHQRWLVQPFVSVLLRELNTLLEGYSLQPVGAADTWARVVNEGDTERCSSASAAALDNYADNLDAAAGQAAACAPAVAAMAALAARWEIALLPDGTVHVRGSDGE